MALFGASSSEKINPFIELYIAGKDHCIRHIFAIPTIHYIEEKGFLMNWTGDEKYDGLFPYHPLSEMRRFIYSSRLKL